MTITDLFADPERRLSRARKHIDDIHHGTQAFIKGQPYVRFVEIDPETGNRVHKVKLSRPIPDDLQDLATETVEALRSVLDKAGFAAAQALGNTRLKGTYFPIADTEDKIGTDIIGRGRCKDLPDKILSLFLGFKPHKAGNPRIWTLNQFANGTKHRILAPAAMAIGNSMQAGLNIGAGKVIEMKMPPTWDDEKDEMIVGVFSPDSKVDYNLQLRSFIKLRQIEGLPPISPAAAALEAMSKEVEKVLTDTRAETIRLLTT